MSDRPIEFASDLVDGWLAEQTVADRAKIERLVRRHINAYWDMDAALGPEVLGRSTNVTSAFLPPDRYLRVWWQDWTGVCAIYHLGFRPAEDDTDDWYVDL